MIKFFINIVLFFFFKFIFSIVKESDFLDKIDYFGCHFGFEDYVRGIRVYFSILPTAKPMKQINLSHKIIIPNIIKKKNYEPNKYESFYELFTREIVSYFNYDNAMKIINFEIVPMKIKDPEKMTRKSIQKNLISCLKVYFQLEEGEKMISNRN